MTGETANRSGGPQNEVDADRQTVEKDQAPPPTAMSRRRALADTYFNEHLRGQQRWYSSRARLYKQCHLWLSLAIIVAGAAVAFIQLFAPGPSRVAIVTALLGAIVVIAKGIERIWLFEDTWMSYRKASEAMKREYRLFINAAGPYLSAPDELQRHARLVYRVEQIMAEEQHAYWQEREPERPSAAPAPAGPGQGKPPGSSSAAG